MNPRKEAPSKRSSNKPVSSYKTGLVLLSLLSSMAVLLIFQPTARAPDMNSVEKALIKKREALDFRMDSFTHGWVQYADGVMITEDGGAHWKEDRAALTRSTTAAPTIETVSWITGGGQQPSSITVQAKEYAVKKSQFLTDKVGWALLSNGPAIEPPLWLTADGGITWNSEVTSDIAKLLQAEMERIKVTAKEASLYTGQDTAQKAIQAEWTLLPETASSGDVVLVRHRQPGDITWEGKTYRLEPFGAGYFTYLPMSMELKPGRYAIGDQFLTIKAKRFEVQYLKVTQQMESMKQDTKHILDDQKKIDQARKESQKEFLFSSNFVQPIEGVLTTPYGYTRYVNGKWDSSHRALDLANKEGTPIKATNDGVVVLAEMLYLTGNSIYIDHGMGLFSQYAHMSELRVKVGDRVKQGDIIGLVGTTGFSTGPHLHFTFWAHNVPVNPVLFFDTTPFHWLQPVQFDAKTNAKEGKQNG